MPSLGTIEYRRFNMSDMPEIIALGSQMHQESNYRDLNWDEEKIYKMAEEWFVNEDYCFADVAICENKIFAMYVGFISEYYFGKDLVANDLLLFVDKSKRGGVAAIRLIKRFQEWAFSKGASEVRPATSTGVQTDDTKKLYEALGYDTVGFVFRKRNYKKEA